MFRGIILLIFFFGILFAAVGVTKIRWESKLSENYNKIIYRYIPRTFEEEQLFPPPVSDVFETMFSQPDPWVTSMRTYDIRKQENINRYFVSQL